MAYASGWSADIGAVINIERENNTSINGGERETPPKCEILATRWASFSPLLSIVQGKSGSKLSIGLKPATASKFSITSNMFLN